MSILLMSQVWERDLDHPAQGVLLALADHANDEGEHVRPSMEYLAWKTGYSLRQVRRIVQSLRRSNILLLVREGRRSPNEYRLDLAPLPMKLQFVRSKEMTAEFRGHIIERDHQICTYCRKSGNATVGPDGQSWHVDRIIPASKGGQYTETNSVLACGTCNRSKGAKMAPKPVDSVTVPSKAQKGAISDISSAIAKAADPSLEPSVEPSLSRAREETGVKMASPENPPDYLRAPSAPERLGDRFNRERVARGEPLL